MQKRIDYYKKLDGDAKENLEESEKAKQEYTQKLADADQEIAEKREQARKAMESAGDMKIQEAEEEARRIIADAQAKNEKDRARMLKEVQNEISDMVASAAEKLSIGASTSQVYDEFLDAAKRSEDDES